MNKKKNRYTFQDSANTFLAIILAQILFLIVYSLIISAVCEYTGMEAEVVTSSDICMFINMILSELIFFLVYLFYNIATQKTGFKKASRINKSFDWKIMLVVILLAVISVFGFNQITELFNYFFTNVLGLNPGSSSFVINTPLKFVICTILMAVFPAIFEELAFRGIIFNGLREKLSPKKAVILCAVLFALMHLSIYKTFYQMLLGVVLSVIIYYTGSITYCMIYHFANNFIIVLMNYITTVTGSTAFIYTTWGVSEVLIAFGIAIVSTVAIGVVLHFVGKYYKKKPNFDKEHIEAYGEIEDAEEEANFVGGNDVTGLSDYEVKQLNSGVFLTAKGWLILSIIIAGFLWGINSFGV